MSTPDAPLVKLAYEYATQEQLRRHSAAHPSSVLFATSAKPSGGFIPGNAKNPAPAPVPHLLSASFRRHPSENLPLVHSSVLAGSKPLRHLHVGTGSAVSSVVTVPVGTTIAVGVALVRRPLPEDGPG